MATRKIRITGRQLDAFITNILSTSEDDDRQESAETAELIARAQEVVAGATIPAVTDEVLRDLANRLQMADDEVRLPAARTLGHIGKAAARPDILEPLAALLVDDDDAVQLTSLWAVGQMGPAAATRSIVRRLAELLSHRDAGVQLATVRVLEMLGPAVATPAIIEGLTELQKHEDLAIRTAAAEALRRVQGALHSFFEWLRNRINEAILGARHEMVLQMRGETSDLFSSEGRVLHARKEEDAEGNLVIWISSRVLPERTAIQIRLGAYQQIAVLTAMTFHEVGGQRTPRDVGAKIVIPRTVLAQQAPDTDVVVQTLPSQQGDA